MQHWLCRAAVLLCLFLPWPAQAAPIYWQLDGDITYNPPYGPYADLSAILPVGTDVSFLIAVDPAAPDQCDNPGAGLYYLSGATMSFGGTSHAGGGWIEVNNPEGNCVDFGTIGTFIRAGFDGVDGLTTITVGFPPGDVLPTTPGAYGFWIGNHVPLYGLENCIPGEPCDGVLFNLFGEITSTTVTPEPSTFLLLAPGLAALASRKCSRLLRWGSRPALPPS